MAVRVAPDLTAFLFGTAAQMPSASPSFSAFGSLITILKL